MERFTAQPGVVLIEIKGIYMLVSDKQARKHCPYVRCINSTAAFLWDAIRKSPTFEEIINAFKERYDICDTEGLERDIRLCLVQLEDKGYIRRLASGGTNFE